MIVGDSVPDPTHALEIDRNMIGPNRSSVTIPFQEPHQLHRIDDADVGDQLFVVTAFAPARGFINAQDFVEFRALASTQGVVVEPLADDVNVELAPDKVVISRPGGLTLSSSLQRVLRGNALRPVTFDSQLWGLDQQATYTERQSVLIAAAAAAPASKRLPTRLDLARFYIARDMYPEAKGVLDVALTEDRPPAEQVSANVLRAVAEVMMNRPDDALRDLSSPSVGDQHDAPLWRALAYARQGKWAQARDCFKNVEAAIATLPVELQRVVLQDEMRAAIETGDFAGAADELNDFETIGVPREMQPGMAVLIGRLAEGMGHSEDALAAYRTAADSWDRPAAAQGRLRETALRYTLGDLKRKDVITELEIADHDLARRRNRDRGAENPGAALHRGGPLPRRLLRHAQRHVGASELGHDAPHPGGGGDDVRGAVSCRQGRYAAGRRRAGVVLRFSRPDADRPPRRRDDPAASRPAGIGRFARSGGTNCCSTRSITGCKVLRGRKSRRALPSFI